MRKFIEWKERPVNFNFVCVITVAAAFILVAAAGYIKFMPEISKEMSELKADINKTRAQEEIDDVGGYGLIMNLFAYGIKSLELGVYIDLPIIIAAGFVFWAVVMRLVYSNKSRVRILIYRIMAAFLYYYMSWATVIYVLGCIEAFMFFPAIILTVFAVRSIITGIRNTYSKRIFGGYYEKNHEEIYNLDGTSSKL